MFFCWRYSFDLILFTIILLSKMISKMLVSILALEAQIISLDFDLFIIGFLRVSVLLRLSVGLPLTGLVLLTFLDIDMRFTVFSAVSIGWVSFTYIKWIRSQLLIVIQFVTRPSLAWSPLLTRGSHFWLNLTQILSFLYQQEVSLVMFESVSGA